MTKRQKFKEEVARHLAKKGTLDLDNLQEVKLAIEEFAQPGVNDRLNDYIDEIIEKPRSWKLFIKDVATLTRQRNRDTREMLKNAIKGKSTGAIDLARPEDIEITKWERRGGRWGSTISDFDFPQDIEGVIYARYKLRSDDKIFTRLAIFHVTDWGWTHWKMFLAGDILLDKRER